MILNSPQRAALITALILILPNIGCSNNQITKSNDALNETQGNVPLSTTTPEPDSNSLRDKRNPQEAWQLPTLQDINDGKIDRLPARNLFLPSSTAGLDRSIATMVKINDASTRKDYYDKREKLAWALATKLIEDGKYDEAISNLKEYIDCSELAYDCLYDMDFYSSAEGRLHMRKVRELNLHKVGLANKMIKNIRKLKAITEGN